MSGGLRSLVSLLAIGAIATVGAVLLFGSGGGYILRLQFADADGIESGQNVEVSGVRAGEVQSVALRGNTAIVTVGLDRQVAPLSADTTAQIRPVSLLGEKYVDLQPGRSRTMLPSGALIPAARTGTSLGLDDVLNTLDPSTGAALRIVIAEAATALDGRGGDLNQLLLALPGGADQVGALVARLSADNRALSGLITSGDRVLASVNSRGNDLGRLIGNAAGALQATAARRAALAATVSYAPATLSQLRESLGRLQTLASQLGPAAGELHTAAKPLALVLGQLPSFTTEALPTLAAARATAPSLQSLADRATPTIVGLRPAAVQLRDVLTDVDPLVSQLDDGTIQDALYFLQTWAQTTEASDGISHLFGAYPVITPDTATHLLDRLATQLGLTVLPSSYTRSARPLTTRPPVRAAVAPSSSARPHPPARGGLKPVLGSLCAKLGDLGAKVGGLAGSLLSSVGSTVARITGPACLPHSTGGALGGGATSGAVPPNRSSGASGAGQLANLLDYLLSP